MSTITLVCTVHREMGLCNLDALVRILAELDPEVIFEEIRPSDFTERYRNEATYTLEMAAISKYSQWKPVQQVPVDDFDLSEGFRRDMDTLFDYVEGHSFEYRRLADERDQKSYNLGFGYLTSLEFESLSRRSRDSFNKAIELSDSVDLTTFLSEWNSQMHKRESSMLENIYRFCRNHVFTKGVFLVGAEHMLAIMDGAQNRKGKEADLVTWRIWNRS